MHQLLLIIHLLGATIWVGGHLVLCVGYLPQALRRRDPAPILDFEARFERLGLPALLAQAVTGVALARRFLPELSDWLSLENFLSTHVAAKLVLLAATLILALDARLRLIPRLGPGNLLSLALHILAVTLIGVLFVIVGAGFRTGGIF